MICIINCGTSHLEDIKKNVSEFKHSYKIINLDEIKDCDFKLFSGIIISGAPTLLTQTDLGKYMELFKFIKAVNIPILGICLGHQIMGLVYGSKIKTNKRISKKESIEIMKPDGLFKGIENHSLFQEDHSEFISLPKDFILLAKSESCSNEAMQHKHKKIFGTQFHPEVSGNNGKNLFRNFLNMYSKN